MQSETRIHLVVHDKHGTKTVVPRAHDELSIGAGTDNRIQIFGDDVALHHARFVARDGTHLIDNLECERIVTVNGRPVQGVELLRAGDRVGIGACTVEVAAGTPARRGGAMFPRDEPRAPGLMEGPPLLREDNRRSQRRPGPARPFFLALVLAALAISAIKSHTRKQRDAERAAARQASAQRATSVETDTSAAIGAAQLGGSELVSGDTEGPGKPTSAGEAAFGSDLAGVEAEPTAAAAEAVAALDEPTFKAGEGAAEEGNEVPAPGEGAAVARPGPRVRARNQQKRRRARRAVSAAARRPSALEVARECLANGDQWCAIRALRKRAKSAPEIALLAETYLAVGRRTEALAQMSRYITLYPRERHARRFRNRVGHD